MTWPRRGHMFLAIWSLAATFFYCTIWSLAAKWSLTVWYFFLDLLPNGDPLHTNIYLILTSNFVLLNHNLYYENRPRRGRMFIEFIPPGTKWYNETFYPARDQKVQWNILSRQGPNSQRHVTPPGSGHWLKSTPEGSYVYGKKKDPTS